MDKKRIDRLILVFDADSGKLGTFVDSMKKVLMLKGCALCAITHGVAGEKRKWKSCRASIGVPVDYLHRDELSPALREIVGEALPCVIAVVQSDHVVLLERDVLERCHGNVNDFKGRLAYHASVRQLSLA